MLYFKIPLSNKYAIAITYPEYPSDLSLKEEPSISIFTEFDSMIIGVDRSVGSKHLTASTEDNPGDIFMIFSSCKGGNVVFSLETTSPVIDLMHGLKVNQIYFPMTFDIEIMSLTSNRKKINFNKCAFGVQSSTDMSLFLIEFGKTTFPQSKL